MIERMFVSRFRLRMVINVVDCMKCLYNECDMFIVTVQFDSSYNIIALSLVCGADKKAVHCRYLWVLFRVPESQSVLVNDFTEDIIFIDLIPVLVFDIEWPISLNWVVLIFWYF